MGTANFRGQASPVLGRGGAGDTDKEEAAPGITGSPFKASGPLTPGSHCTEWTSHIHRSRVGG